jgi:lysophospholipase L1-like esterase
MRATIPALPIRDERVRQIAVAAAKGGGGLLGVGTAVVGATVGVLAYQAARAKREIGPRRTVPPYADGRYLPPGMDTARGTSLRLAFLGDSGAAGLGADDADGTPGGALAADVAVASGRAVLLSNAAVVGARSKDLAAQVERVRTLRPHVAVVMIGANDITHSMRPQRSVRLLGDAVRRLREEGTEVVVGTCPDLGTVEPLGGALKRWARRMSRELAAAQTIAVEAEGARAVQLGTALAPLFDAHPELYFSADRFHPSALGYQACAEALLPAVLDVLGIDTGPGLPMLPAAP